MLVQLSSDQVANYWDFIKYGVEEAIIPTVGIHDERMSEVLESIMLGKMVVWVSANKDTKVIDGVVCTVLQTDELSKTKSLLIYSLYGTESMRSSWSDGLEQLQKYAKTEGCHKILAYSNLPEIISYVEHIGGNADFRLLILPL